MSLVVLSVAFRNEALQLSAFSVPDVVCLLRKPVLGVLFLHTTESTNDTDRSSFLNMSYRIGKFILYLKSFVLDRINLHCKITNQLNYFYSKKPVTYAKEFNSVFLFSLQASTCNFLFFVIPKNEEAHVDIMDISFNNLLESKSYCWQ